MRIGIFADAHDHLANIRLAVERFNQEQVEVVLFAGDIVSTISVPPLKRLNCKVVACFGDNEGNKIGLKSGFTGLGTIEEAPVRYTANDGTRFVIVHMKRQLRGLNEEFDIQIVGHTHKARVEREPDGRMLINPGETSGWSFGRPTIAVLETTTREVQIIDLLPTAPPSEPLPAAVEGA
ncbi:YfcE family phosphodiesterase [Anatilimnocola floriformis]|uniref:YfcE family phosphodiesterase n=1 Tax=Anatilimnocola floriformis TaxID=2948575 RepID=UPI0020C3341A|nr:YfcE family phosphodiesterase [Anatilimnocola floriformis]